VHVARFIKSEYVNLMENYIRYQG